jgi:hypothetical protein
MAEGRKRTDTVGIFTFRRSSKEGYSATMKPDAITLPNCAAILLAWRNAQK